MFVVTYWHIFFHIIIVGIYKLTDGITYWHISWHINSTCQHMFTCYFTLAWGRCWHVLSLVICWQISSYITMLSLAGSCRMLTNMAYWQMSSDISILTPDLIITLILSYCRVLGAQLFRYHCPAVVPDVRHKYSVSIVLLLCVWWRRGRVRLNGRHNNSKADLFVTTMLRNNQWTIQQLPHVKSWKSQCGNS